jgi:hypothetical protein
VATVKLMRLLRDKLKKIKMGYKEKRLVWVIVNLDVHVELEGD